MLNRTVLVLLVFAFVFVLPARPTRGQIPNPLSGVVVDGAPGPLISGAVYNVVGNINVPAGSTLTIPFDVVLKFMPGTSFTIDGTLICNGTPNGPIAFTSFADDSHGGDTNGNGPSLGAPGDWRGLVFNGGAGASHLDHCQVLWGGSSGFAGIQTSAGITVLNTLISDFVGHGLDLQNVDSGVTIANSAIENNGGYAVTNCPIQSLAGFSATTASGNVLGDYQRVTVGTLTTSLTINPNNLLGTVFVAATNLFVPTGLTLTLSTGVTIKFSAGTQLTVDGTLDANTGVGTPISFTSIADDTRGGGDTNKDGPSTGTPGDWRGIVFNANSGASVLNHCDVVFAGNSAFFGLQISAGITVTNTLVAECANDAIGLQNVNSGVTITNCQLMNNVGYPLENVDIRALANFSGNTASGNTLGDYAHITVGNVSAPQSIGFINLPNSVLVVDTNVSIPPGSSLTLEPGLIVKFTTGVQVTIDGTLTCLGASGNPIVFTSLDDDAHGGDTNNNGATTGTPGDWRGLVFGTNSGASVLDQCEIVFAGNSFFFGLEISAGITVTNTLVAECASDAIGLQNVNSGVTITNCQLMNNVGYPLENVDIRALANFSGNTASGNTLGDYAHITVGNVSTPMMIGFDNLPNAVLVVDTNLSIPSTSSLSLESGLVVKFTSGQQVMIDGTLTCLGASGNPIVFTSLEDDAHGGDTNNNGATTGTPGDWRGLVFNTNSGASVLDQCEIVFAGNSFFFGLEISAGITVTNTLVAECASDAIGLQNVNSGVTITNCQLMNNVGYPLENVDIRALANFSGNTASGNTLGDYAHITVGNVSAPMMIGSDNLPNSVLVVDANVSIPSGSALTLEPGLIVKFTTGVQVTIDGTLTCLGASGNPIVFTSLDDDAHGGDTAKDGATAGTPGNWRGLVFNTGAAASVLDHCEVFFAGNSAFAGMQIGAPIQVSDCRVSDGAAQAILLGGGSVGVVIANGVFTNNGAVAIEGASLNHLPFFINNQATGNGGDYVHIVNGTVTSDLAIGPENLMGSVGVLAASVSVGNPRRLTLLPGVIFKFQSGLQFTVSGTLDIQGTGSLPVVLTSLADDAFGGDTNNDGTTTAPSAGAWRGVVVQSSATNSRIEHALIRYTGNSGFAALENQSATTALRSVRVEHTAGLGFQLSDAGGNPSNLVAFDCLGDGIRLQGGGFALRHATSTANGGMGVTRTAGSATVINTISWNNGGGNYTGFGMGDIIASDGDPVFAGLNGNIDVDPQFVDPSLGVGDLDLMPLSPCVNTGDQSTGINVFSDFREASRVLDAQLDGNMLADMGAYEYSRWHMDAVGAPRIGGAVTFTVTGDPGGLVVLLSGLLDGAFFAPPYGFILAGNATLSLVTTVSVGTSVTAPIPADPSIIGFPFGIQAVTLLAVDPSKGNAINMYRAKVLP